MAKVVADVAIPVIRARVLQQYFEGTNPGRAQYYHRELRRARAAYKRYKLSGVSYEDYLDWVTSSYSNEPR
jgi:effector-binding domain-containing protein